MRWYPIALAALLIGCDLEDTKDTTEPDNDADGYTADVDCDDDDETVFPDAAEVCDGIDNDCDSLIDDADDSVDTTTGATFYADTDGDGYGDDASTADACDLPSGYAADSGDCDDADVAVFPGAAEVCDGQYNDCSDPSYAAGGVPAPEVDGDLDGYVSCDYDTLLWVGDSAVIGGGDCDDTDATLSPGVTEVCDSIDNDCDGLTDDDDDSLDTSTGTVFYADTDGDSYGDVSSSVGACLQPKGYVLDDQDCDDSNFNINPDAPENPQDGVDDNCDGYDGCSDLDCDGYTDVYVSGISTGSYHNTYLGDGTGLTQDTTLSGCGAYDSEQGDLNGDGYVDLVNATYYCTGYNFVHYGSSTGYSDKNAEILVDGDGLEIIVEDLNSDGYDDVVVGAYADTTGYIYWGSAVGLKDSTALTVDSGWDVQTGDTNADGYTDVVFCATSGDSYLFYGSSTGYSQKDSDIITTYGGYSCRLEDLDSDGYPEFITSGYSSTSDALIYWGSSAGYSDKNRTSLNNAISYGYGITTGDYNADGYRDIFYSSWSGNNSVLYYGSASGYSTLDTASLDSTSSTFRSISTDLDGDGYDDLVTNSVSHGTGVFMGSATGLATVADYSLSGNYAYNSSATDLDGDGYQEILVADYGNSEFRVYWGAATGWSSKAVDTDTSTANPFAAPLVVGLEASTKSE